MGKRGAKPMIVSDELKNAIVRDYKRGICITQLINIHGLKRWRITEIIKASGETIKTGVRKGSNSLFYESVKQDYKDGLDATALAKKYKVARSYIYQILDQDKLVNGRDFTYKTKRIMADIKSGDLSLSEIARRYGLSRQRVFTLKERMEKDNG
jgi:transposase-like protein